MPRHFQFRYVFEIGHARRYRSFMPPCVPLELRFGAVERVLAGLAHEVPLVLFRVEDVVLSCRRAFRSLQRP